MHALIRQIGEHWLVEPGDTFLVPSPIAHIGGSIYAFECPLLLGHHRGADGPLGSRRRGGTDARTHRCTHMAGATPFLQQLLAAAERAGTRLPDLKVFICGGASVSPSLIRRATDYFDAPWSRRVYGSTEVPVTTVGARSATPTMRLTPTAGPASPTSGWSIGEIRARGGPQMLRRLPASRGRCRSLRCRRLLPHRRSRRLGRRRVPRRHRPGQGHHHPQRGEHLAQGDRGHPHQPSRHRRDRRRRRSRPADRRAGLRGHRARPADAHRTSTDCAWSCMAHGVAKFKVPEQVEIWDALPKNDAGKVLSIRSRASS